VADVDGASKNNGIAVHVPARRRLGGVVEVSEKFVESKLLGDASRRGDTDGMFLECTC
jgi:hypothetical protein